MTTERKVRKLWFYYQNATVFGPFDEGELKTRLGVVPSQADIKIWKLGANSTLRFSEWTDQEKSPNGILVGRVVKIRVGERLEAGPFEPFDAVEYLRELESIDNVWFKLANTSADWVAVRSIDQIAQILKADARRYPRLKCDGDVELTSGQIHVRGRLEEISMGGFRSILYGGTCPIHMGAHFEGHLKVKGLESKISFTGTLVNRNYTALGVSFKPMDQKTTDLLDSFLAFSFRRQAESVFEGAFKKSV